MASSYTMAEIKKRVWDRLGEQYDSGTDTFTANRYTEAIVFTFANEAQEQWSEAIGTSTSRQIITLLDDTLEYTLNRDFVREFQILDDETDTPLIPIHWRELYETEGIGRNRRWRDVRSDRPTHYSRFSYDKIWVWPPQADAAGRLLFVDYFQTNQEFTGGPGDEDLNDDSDLPDIPAEYQSAMVDYIVGRCLMLNARGDRLQRGLVLMQTWLDMLQKGSEDNALKGSNFRRSVWTEVRS